MALTLFGMIAAGICLLMLILRRPLREFFAGQLICAVFGATEAVALPMLGGASLTLPYLFVFFVFLRLLFVAARRPALLTDAILSNLWLVLFALYGVMAALIMPRLFEGAMALTPMRPTPYLVLLTPTSQNITQAFYIMLTALTALSAYVTARLPRADEALLFGLSVATVIFVFCALIDLAGFYSGAGDLLAWLKTASYQMLSQVENGVRRISGSFAEPSAFAGFGSAPLLVFMYCWLLDVRRQTSGLLALATAAVMALSTSSTAFLMLFVSIAMVVVYGVSMPMNPMRRKRKFITMIGILIGCVLASALLAVLMPKFVDSFAKVFEGATVGKSKTQSAIERGTWAAQGFEAFRISKGWGIGPGSFRSSGLFQAVLGSLGAIGVACLGLYLLKLAQILTRKVPRVDRRLVIVSCLSALLILTPAFLVSAGPDPGILFAVMAGYALGGQKRARLESAAIRAQLRQEAELENSRSRTEPQEPAPSQLPGS